MTITEPLLPAERAARVKASAARLDFEDPSLFRDAFARLFAVHPELDQVLPNSEGGQQLKYAAMMEVILSTLDPPEEQELELPGLGQMHVLFGAEPDYYTWLSEAVIAGLAAKLGDHWTPELAADWAELFSLVSAQMMAGAAALEDQL
ncbi:globin domain-containing protein [Thioclava sp. F28-4]|uniref:globin domain-containing protein n=1 Tax=Thioclava sp. F28-4 TaxID=1915315 RepID=UPI0009971312|nr:globin domain-containing protein [Thioclava sp. F28-4]OOY06520.1 hypothetical protein BMI87_03240 [Thioclava sp. F28-4]